MEFKKEELIAREKEIGQYLLEENSLHLISTKTGLSKPTIQAHIKNMIKKLNTEDTTGLLKLLKTEHR